MNPRTVCFCQPILSMISACVAPFFRWSIATTWAVLLPSRAPSAFGFAAFGVLAAFLAGGVFFALAVAAGLGLPPLAPFWPLGAPFFGAALAACAATAAAVSVVFSVSAVIIVNSPSAVITAVRTWITPVGRRSKRILPDFDDGEGLAMKGSASRSQMGADEG